MSNEVIIGLNQVTTTWLTSVLMSSGALLQGEVAAFDLHPGRGNWSTNCRLTLRYVDGSKGALPRQLFLKMVNANASGESFGSSEVTYYTHNYAGVVGVPLVRCYDAAYSEELQRYHILLDDLSATHIEAAEKKPTLEYGLALAEGLAAMHARWWGAKQFTQIDAAMHTSRQIRRFVNISESGVGNIVKRFSTDLEPHWPDFIRELFAKHPQLIIARNLVDNGFTLIHGDVGQKNILVPRDGDRPIYIIDRQPFDWSLTTWLGVYDLAYAIVLDWDIETRRSFEIPILRHYHDQIMKNGVYGYSWEQLYADYRLCAPMCVYVAAEYFRGDANSRWISSWLLMLRRSLTACEDWRCSDYW